MVTTIKQQQLAQLAAHLQTLPTEPAAIATLLATTQAELNGLAQQDLRHLTPVEQQLAEQIVRGYQNLISSIKHQRQKVRHQIKALSNDKRGTMANYLQYQPQASLIEMTY